ncbi:MAG: hypothetical protein R3351_07845 [Nitrospirales bacterium]|nr:hypothetical protein [Nitrospirales bacterium]
MGLLKINQLIHRKKQGRPDRSGPFQNWKNLGKALLFSIMLFGVSACGLFPQEDLKGWVGFHREELIRVMGPPTKETPLPDGGTKLEFIQRITKHPSAAQQYGVSYICHKTFILDSKGFITDASKEGC